MRYSFKDHPDGYIQIDVDYQGTTDSQKFDRVFVPDDAMPAGYRLSITRTGPLTRRIVAVKIAPATHSATPQQASATQIPETLAKLKQDDDGALEALAAKHGVKVDDKWRRQAWAKRLADVATRMNEKAA